MSGPSNQSTNTIVIPPGEGRRIFSPVPLAWLVENLETEDDDTLTSVVGPSILRIKPRASLDDGFTFSFTELSSDDIVVDPEFVGHSYNTDRPHSIFFARLLNGSADTLYYRFGEKLYRFRGEVFEEDEVILSGLTSSPASLYPDQYVVMNNKVIFTNGVDRPRIISYDGSVDYLGYSRQPPTPTLSGPSQPESDDAVNYYPNSSGYSFPGRIGTPGDTLTGRKGSLLAGQWYYYFQFEDRHGNLSSFSSRSESVSTKAAQAYPYSATSLESGVPFGVGVSGDDNARRKRLQTDGSEIDDLTRRFLVSMSGDAPEHTVAVRIFRTPDTQHVDNVPRFLTRVPGSKTFVFDDNQSDSELGSTWDETVSTPVFRVMCVHQGRLIIGNFPGDPGMVRRSEPGFPGTFLKDDFIYPDAGGADITGLVSHNGVLLAFTETAVYAIGDDFVTPQPLSLGVGCSAPRSIVARKDGTLMWLSRDGFYGMRELGSIVRLSSPIDKIFKADVNYSRLHLATAIVDSRTGEYRCSFTAKCDTSNKLMFCFDGKFWRRQTLGLNIVDMCVSNDEFRYVFAIGSDKRERHVKISSVTEATKTNPRPVEVVNHLPLNRVFVLDRQTPDWFGPPRKIRYRSNWIFSSEFGLVPTNVRTLYVGMKDAWNGTATVRIYKNGSWAPVHEMKDLRLIGVDDESDIVNDIVGNAEFQSAKFHESRLFWRQIPVDLQNVSSWAFEIETSGFPSPYSMADVETPPAPGGLLRVEDVEAMNTLDNPGGLSVFGLSDVAEKMRDNQFWPELGRMKISAFAFDISVATKGTPLGRVPRRKDV